MAGMLAKKADDAAKRHSVILLTRRLIEEQKMYESPNQKCSVSPLFAAMAYVLVLLSGYEMGRDHGKRMYERQEPEESS